MLMEAPAPGVGISTAVERRSPMLLPSAVTEHEASAKSSMDNVQASRWSLNRDSRFLCGQSILWQLQRCLDESTGSN